MRPDPLNIRQLTQRALGDPQAWNLYAYVRNQPTIMVDPDGKTFNLSDNEKKRNEQLALIKKSLQNAEAAKHVVAVKDKNGNWVVGIQGISGKDFNKLGTAAHGLNHLVNSVNDYKLEIGKSTETAQGGGAATDKGTIYLDPGAFPKDAGGVKETADTALAHEMGHLLEGEFGAGYIQSIKEKAGRSFLVQSREGFAVAYENAVRAEAQPPLDPRSFYIVPGDYADPGVSPIIP